MSTQLYSSLANWDGKLSSPPSSTPAVSQSTRSCQPPDPPSQSLSSEEPHSRVQLEDFTSMQLLYPGTSALPSESDSDNDSDRVNTILMFSSPEHSASSSTSKDDGKSEHVGNGNGDRKRSTMPTSSSSAMPDLPVTYQARIQVSSNISHPRGSSMPRQTVVGAGSVVETQNVDQRSTLDFDIPFPHNSFTPKRPVLFPSTGLPVVPLVNTGISVSPPRQLSSSDLEHMKPLAAAEALSGLSDIDDLAHVFKNYIHDDEDMIPDINSILPANDISRISFSPDVSQSSKDDNACDRSPTATDVVDVPRSTTTTGASTAVDLDDHRETSASGSSTLIDLTLEDSPKGPSSTKPSASPGRPTTPLFLPSPPSSPQPEPTSPKNLANVIDLSSPEAPLQDLPDSSKGQRYHIIRTLPLNKPLVITTRKITSPAVPDSLASGEPSTSRRSLSVISISSTESVSLPDVRTQRITRPHKRRKNNPSQNIAYVLVPSLRGSDRKEDFISNHPALRGSSSQRAIRTARKRAEIPQTPLPPPFPAPPSSPLSLPPWSAPPSPRRSLDSKTRRHTSEFELGSQDDSSDAPPMQDSILLKADCEPYDDDPDVYLIRTESRHNLNDRLVQLKISLRHLRVEFAVEDGPRPSYTSWTQVKISASEDGASSYLSHNPTSGPSDELPQLSVQPQSLALTPSRSGVPPGVDNSMTPDPLYLLPDDTQVSQLPDAPQVLLQSANVLEPIVNIPSVPSYSAIMNEDYIQQNPIYTLDDDPLAGLSDKREVWELPGSQPDFSTMQEFDAIWDGTIDPSLLGGAPAMTFALSPPLTPLSSPKSIEEPLQDPFSVDPFPSSPQLPTTEPSSLQVAPVDIFTLTPSVDDDESDNSDQSAVSRSVSPKATFANKKGKGRARDVGFRTRASQPKLILKDRCPTPMEGKRERRLSRRAAEALECSDDGNDHRSTTKANKESRFVKAAARRKSSTPFFRPKDHDTTTLNKEYITELAQAPTYCHHCRRKTFRPKMKCTQIRADGEYCNLRFCSNCIEKRYPDIIFDAFAVQFECPKCTDTCNCSQCSRRRGDEYIREREGGYLKYLQAVCDLSPDPSSPPEEPAVQTLNLPQGNFWGTVYGAGNMQRIGVGLAGKDKTVIILPAARKRPFKKREFVGIPQDSWRRLARSSRLSPSIARSLPTPSTDNSIFAPSPFSSGKRFYVGSRPVLFDPQYRSDDKSDSSTLSSITPSPDPARIAFVLADALDVTARDSSVPPVGSQ